MTKHIKTASGWNPLRRGPTGPSFASGRQFFVHHMSSINAGGGAMRFHTVNQHTETANDNRGGRYRNLPLAPYGLNMNNAGMADLDIKRAMRIGVDGFAVNCWAGGAPSLAYFQALFAACELNNYNFQIAPILDNSNIGGVDNVLDPEGNPYPDKNSGKWGSAIQRAVNTVQCFLDYFGDSPHLAKRHGKMMVFTWNAQFFGSNYATRKLGITNAEVMSTDSGRIALGRGLREIQYQTNHPLYISFDTGALFNNNFGQRPNMAIVCDQLAKNLDHIDTFLPSWLTDPNERESRYADSAALVKARGADWGEAIFPQYQNVNNSATIPVRGSAGMRYGFDNAATRSDLLQFTTWSDYVEGSNLAPGIDTRHAFFDLAAYFISKWKTGVAPTYATDKVYIFSRKHRIEANTAVKNSFARRDGAIEIVTILNTPATIHVPGRGTYAAPAGFNSQFFPVTVGPVSAEVWRAGVKDIDLILPEPVTDRPWRNENGIAAICTEELYHWEEDFGEGTPQFNFSEYGDVDSDGLPNWFEMYYQGHYTDMTTAGVMNPTADLNASGRTNLEEFALNQDPNLVEFDPSPPAVDLTIDNGDPYLGTPFVVAASGATRIQAQDFNTKRDKGYYDYHNVNQGLQYRTGDSVDVASIGGGETGDFRINFTRAGEWLKYTIDVAVAGYYDFRVRYASNKPTSSISVSFSEENLTGDMSLPLVATGGSWWNVFATESVQHIPLRAGVQIMMIKIGGELYEEGPEPNWYELEASGTSPVADITTDIPSTGTVDTEITITPTLPVTDVTVVRLLVDGVVEAETHGPTFALNYTPTIAGTETLQVVAIGLPGGYHTSAEVEVTVSAATTETEPVLLSDSRAILMSDSRELLKTVST